MHPNSRRHANRLAAPAALLLVAAVIAGCGSSASSSNHATTKAAGASTAPQSGSARGPARFTALRECLKKAGITLPKPKAFKPGQGRPRGLSPFNRQLPKGVTQAQLQAALKKCGAGTFPGRGRVRINTASFRKALAKFTACMSSHGITLPAPNTSGRGPIFNTERLATNTTKFREAQRACASSSPLQALPGASGGPAGSGASPGGVPGGPGVAPPAGTGVPIGPGG